MAESPLQLILAEMSPDPPDDSDVHTFDHEDILAVAGAARCLAMVTKPQAIHADDIRQLLRDHLQANAEQ